MQKVTRTVIQIKGIFHSLHSQHPVIFSFITWLCTFLISLFTGHMLTNYSLKTELKIREHSRIFYDLSKDSNDNKISMKQGRIQEGFLRNGAYIPKDFTINYNGVPQSYLILSCWSIKNTGVQSIKKEDIDSPITVKTQGGARLLSIDYDLSKWEFSKVGDDSQEAVMEPALFNSGDEQIVIISYTYSPDNESSKTLLWDARIAGVPSIIVKDYFQIRFEANNFFLTSVYLEKMEIYFFLFIFLLLFVLPLSRICNISNKWLKQLSLSISALLSIASAESIVCISSLINDWNIRDFSWHLIIPIFVIHVGFLIIVFVVNKNKLALR